MKLNDKEKRLLDLLRANPYVTQKEIALSMELSRPAVANMISGLQEKGYILGKPYVLRTDAYVTCIGSANMDVTLMLNDALIKGTSNPVQGLSSYGGVIRNVAENLARLHVNVSLMSLVGDDAYGLEILSSSQTLMETFATETIAHESTGTYYAVIDKKGDMAYGFASMAINEHMDRSWILRHKKHLVMSKYIICDLNVSKEAIETLLELKEELDVPLAIVGVSGPKMSHLPDDLDVLDVLICNVDETQTYFKTDINDVSKLCQLWLDKGVKKVVVTAGIKGSYYGENNNVLHQKANDVDPSSIVDVTGAGDAFSSAFMYGIIHGYSLSEAVKLGTVNASLTIQVPHAVNPNISIKTIKEELKKS